MTHRINQEQKLMWESVQILSQIDMEKAKVVFKATVEKSLQQLQLTSSVFSSLRFSIPGANGLSKLRQMEEKMRAAYTQREEEKAYTYLVDYIEQLSQTAEGDPVAIQKKLLASLLAARHNPSWSANMVQEVPLYSYSTPFLSKQNETAYYTPNEVAQKIGLSDQTIRRMCENKKFQSAYKTQGGHWKIPQDSFLTTAEQDEKAEILLKQIDEKNREAGDVDEFNL